MTHKVARNTREILNKQEAIPEYQPDPEITMHIDY